MRGDTAIGHVDAHNELRSGILREAERFGTTVDIGGPYQVNDPGHVQEHEKTRAALDLIAKTAGVTVTLPPVRKLGDHQHSPSDHDLLDQALSILSKADAWNDATGGTISDYSKDGKRYRRHIFTASGAFVVTRAVRPFTVTVVSAGGGGGPGNPYHGIGGSGGGGGAFTKSMNLEAISYPAQVGSAVMGFGGDSSLNGLIAGGGAPGIAAQYRVDGGQASPGRNGSEGGTSTGGHGGYAGLEQSTFPGLAIRDAYGLAPLGIGNQGPAGNQEPDLIPNDSEVGQAGGLGGGGAIVIDYQIGTA